VKNCGDDKEGEGKAEFYEMLEFFGLFYLIFAQLSQFNCIKKSLI